MIAVEIIVFMTTCALCFSIQYKGRCWI